MRKKTKYDEALAYEAALKPCPFCGSDAEIVVKEGLSKEPVFWAQCRRCGVYTPPVLWFGTAATQWNRRTDSPAIEPPFEIGR